MYSGSELDKFFDYLNKVADGKELSAGMGGRRDDGGAGNLRNQVAYYKMGSLNVMPYIWEKYVKEYEAKTDPEYAKYLELKNKFE